MAENLLTYTEFDGQGCLTTTYSRVWAEDINMGPSLSYLLKDFGVGYFDGNITISFGLWLDDIYTYGAQLFLCLFATRDISVGDGYSLKNNNEEIIGIRCSPSGGELYLYPYEAYDGNETWNPTEYQYDSGSYRWGRFLLDKSYGTYGRITLKIYTTKAKFDSDTPDYNQSLNLHKKVNYRDFYPISSNAYSSGDTRTSIAIENIAFSEDTEACPMPAGTQLTPYVPVEIWTRIPGRATATTANKLVDSNAQFSTWGVEIGTEVHNRTDDNLCYVSAVDSETQLSITSDNFADGEFYTLSTLYVDATSDVIEIDPWNEWPFSANATIKLNNPSSKYDALDTRNKFIRMKRGYTSGGVNYSVSTVQWMKIIDHGWGSWPTWPRDYYPIHARGLWDVLSAYKIPEDFHFNNSDYTMANYTEITDITAYSAIEFILLLAGLSLGSDIEDQSAEYIYSLKPKVLYPAGTSGAYIVISLLAMFSANLVCRQDKMHFITDSIASKDYEYRCPHNASYLSFKGGVLQEGLPKFLKAEVWSDDTPTYSGEYIDSSWTEDMGVVRYIDSTGICTSDAICAAIAQSIVEREIDNIETGSYYLEIMDCCQEPYVNSTFTDSRANTTQAGLTGGVKFRYHRKSPGGVYDCWVICGGLGRMVGDDLESYVNRLALGLGGGIPSNSVLGSVDFVTAASGFTDNHLVKADGSGKVIQDTGVTLSDTNHMTGFTADSPSILVDRLAGATYDDLQDYINFFGNRTIISGGAITDNGDGSCAVAALTGWIKATDSVTASGLFFNFAGDSSVSLNDLEGNYLQLDYNGGTPQIIVATEPITTTLQRDHFPVGVVYRDGTTLCIINPDYSGTDPYPLGQLRDFEIDGIARASGMETSSTGTRNLVVTAGVMWAGYYRITPLAFDTSRTGTADADETNKLHDADSDFTAGDEGKWVWNIDDSVYGVVTDYVDSGELTLASDAFPDGNEDYYVDWFCTYYTSDSGSTWTKTNGIVQVDNTYYNNIASGLVELTANRYAVHWLYMNFTGNHLMMVYGQGDYTAAGAESASVPSVIPKVCSSFGILIAKIIVQKGSDTLVITKPWTSAFTSSLATDHGSLAGLGDDDHTQYLLANGTRALTGNMSAGGYQITNLACENGATFPASPTDGMWFRHQTTGRDILYQYDFATTSWKALCTCGATTFYVDKTDGTDGLSYGTGVDADAFATVQYAINAIPGLVNGNVTIYVNAEDYAATWTIRGKQLTGNYTISIIGTLSSQEVETTATVTAGSGRAHGTVEGTLDADYSNMLAYFATDGEYRLIDSNAFTLGFDGGQNEPTAGDIISGGTSNAIATFISVDVTGGAWATNDASGTLELHVTQGTFQDNEVLTNDTQSNTVGDSDTAGGNSANNNIVLLCGTAPSSTNQDVTFYDWGTKTNRIYVLDGQQGVRIYNIHCDDTYGFYRNNYTESVCERCKFDYAGVYSLYLRAGYTEFYDCYFEADGNNVYIEAGEQRFYRCKIYTTTASDRGVWLLGNSVSIIAQGTVIDAGSTTLTRGIYAEQGAKINMYSVAADGYPKIRNQDIGAYARWGAQIVSTSTNVYSGNTTDESVHAASYGYID